MRFRQRSLGREVLLNGADSLEIIESYLDDKYLHVFCGAAILKAGSSTRCGDGCRGDNVRVVTMYVPSLDEWDSDYRVRRVTE